MAAAVSPRQYADWFAWALPHVSDPERAHVAAATAVNSLAKGADPATAATAAQQAATSASGVKVNIDERLRIFAGWYAWARTELGVDADRAETAARAAQQAELAGQGAQGAAAAARAALSAPGSIPPPPSAMPQPAAVRPGGGSGLALLADPAIRGIGWGVLCLIAPFTIHIIFPLLPVFGLIYGVRAMRASRVWVGFAGLAVNAVATLLTAFLWIAAR